MTTEERELYCYATGTEPFMTEIENINVEMVDSIITISNVVQKAANKYHKDYCSHGDECFSQKDIRDVTNKIYTEKVGN